MPTYGKRSKKNLAECDARLRLVFNEVIRHRDCSVIEGHRPEAEQNRLFLKGISQLKFPNGRHNTSPSFAADVVPWFAEKPHIRWNDEKSFREFAHFVLGVAAAFKVKLRWGGDWDGDGDSTDQSFHDLPHFELIE